MSDAPASPASTPAPGAPPATDPAAPPAAAPPAPSAPGDWRAMLPPELRDTPTLAKFQDPAALARSYTELESLVGRKGVILPTDKDPPEVQQRFRAALGVPEKPEGYALAPPEGVPAELWDGERATAFAGLAHQLALTPAQAKAIAEWAAKDAAGAMQKFTAGIEPDGRQMDEVLREEWGGQYEARVDRAKRAAQQFGDDAALAALESKIGGAALVRMFAKIGVAMGEDEPAGMGTGAARGTPGPAEAKAERERLMAKGSPYWDRWHPDHEATKQRVTALFQVEAKAQP